jgi:dephospho-CoA kinase
MRVFGLTGGVASGKGVVAGQFRRRGVPVIDADALAREVVEPGRPALDELAALFGPDVLGSDGRLDRKCLAALAFNDADALARLNGIVHPRVAERLSEELTRLQAAGHSLVCYEVPLLFENGLQDRFRPVVLVAASPGIQLQRAMARDGWTEQEAMARIASQMPLDEKRAMADYVIDNGGAIERTLKDADRVLDTIHRDWP